MGRDITDVTGSRNSGRVKLIMRLRRPVVRPGRVCAPRPARPVACASMRQRHLGRSGLSVSRLGLGTMTWGQDTGPAEAAAQLTAFVDAGGNLVDTADVYCDGTSELILGRLVRG